MFGFTPSLFISFLIFAQQSNSLKCGNTSSSELAREIKSLQYRLFTELQTELGMVHKAVFQTTCSEKGCYYSAKQHIDGINTTKECPQGWKMFQNNCYLMKDGKMNWFQADLECKKLNSNLVAIHSKEGNDWIRKWALTSGREGDYWLGSNSLAVVGNFVWTEDATTLVFKDFAPGQPDNPKTERCLHFYKYQSYRWNDEPCLANAGMICETKDEKHLN